MAINIGTSSRLRFSELRIIDGVTFWDIVELPVFRSRTTDLTHVVTASDRLDSLAKTHYGDEAFWWVIAWANDFEVLPTDLNVGAEIVIPDPQFVKSDLFPEVASGT